MLGMSDEGRMKVSGYATAIAEEYPMVSKANKAK